ncbi:MAG: hypothetical protein H6Q26_229 [Bacteroidetes bacterium]|nr:hypothetical protein [Bacteroidota bacterium]
MKNGIHQREMKTIFRKNIHEKWNSPTKMKTIFKEKEGIKLMIPPFKI